MYAVALRAGSWPPSPGFEPWAILISSWSARARYAAVTPNRAEATCLILASCRSPSGPGRVPGGVLAALAGVRGAAGALDADRQRLVGLGESAPTRHRRHDEPARRCRARPRPRRAGSASRGAADRSASRGTARSAGARRGPSGSARARRRRRRRCRRRDEGMISPAIFGEKRWASPSALKRANPGSGSAVRGRGRGAIEASGRRAPELARARVSRRPIRPGQAGGRREAARDARVASSSMRLEQGAADVRGDRADAHPGEGLAEAGLERGQQVRRPRRRR